MTKHLYIVRHGETEYNALGICQGQKCNAGLNENGRKQAENLALKLKDKNIGAVYSSPLLRAYETAEITASSLNLQTIVHQGLIEGNFGVAEGIKMDEVRTWEIYPQWTNAAPEYDDAHYEGGESKRQIRTRILKALAEICAAETAENILIVSHSAVVRLLNWCAGNFIHGLPNGTVYEFTYDNGILKPANARILLLSCCAPCSCAVIKTLAEKGVDFAVAFYNPNIRPLAEYQKRCAENKRLCTLYGVEFIEFEYDNDRWCELTAGLENEPERGARCSICFYMRLKRVMEYAKTHGFTAVASVLGVSRYKDLQQVNKMADKAAADTGFAYVEIEGRKGGMQELRQQLIKELDLYNQEYCGCKPR